jgi:predicted porin
LNKTLIALAALMAAGAACAQSSVTLFGIVDVGVNRSTASGTGSTDLTQVTSGALNTSRIGFRGVEDLGGGLQASFWLEGQVFADDGRGGSAIASGNQSITTPAGSGLNFGRRSTLSLSGTWGEIRVGRDLSPINYIYSGFDPFANVGVGTNMVVFGVATALGADPNLYGFQPAGQGTTGPWVRVSNMVNYFSPASSPFIVHAAYWVGETPGTGANRKDGSGGGLRLGYTSGPFNVQAAWQETRFRASPVTATAGAPSGNHNSIGIAGSWDFKVAKLWANFERDTRESALELRGDGGMVGATVPVGSVGLIRTTYSFWKTKAGTQPEARKFALGYVHNLSKRTALYTTYAHVQNKNGARVALGGSTFGTGVTDGKSNGLDLGLRHTF